MTLSVLHICCATEFPATQSPRYKEREETARVDERRKDPNIIVDKQKKTENFIYY